jgi:hypothetical protein
MRLGSVYSNIFFVNSFLNPSRKNEWILKFMLLGYFLQIYWNKKSKAIRIYY